MAQTKRRRTKHRGNAAGMIETRGRTGRKPTEAEAKAKGGAGRGPGGKPNRFDKEPSWRASINRALIAVVFFVVLLLVIPGFDVSPLQILPLAAFMLLIYIPMGYYTDQFMYRRRQRNLANPKPAPKPKGDAE